MKTFVFAKEINCRYCSLPMKKSIYDSSFFCENHVGLIVRQYRSIMRFDEIKEFKFQIVDISYNQSKIWGLIYSESIFDRIIAIPMFPITPENFRDKIHKYMVLL